MTGISRPTVNKILKVVRQRIAEICEAESPFETDETEAVRKVLAQGMNFYMKEDGCVNDVIKLLRNAPPLEMSYSDHWDAIKKIRELL